MGESNIKSWQEGLRDPFPSRRGKKLIGKLQCWFTVLKRVQKQISNAMCIHPLSVPPMLSLKPKLNSYSLFRTICFAVQVPWQMALTLQINFRWVCCPIRQTDLFCSFASENGNLDPWSDLYDSLWEQDNCTTQPLVSIGMPVVSFGFTSSIQ